MTCRSSSVRCLPATLALVLALAALLAGAAVAAAAPAVITFDKGPTEGERVNSGVVHFEFHVDQDAALACGLDGAALADCKAGTFDGKDLAEGHHELTVRATPANTANQAATVTRNWFVDTTLPASVILSGPDDGAMTTSRTATFTYESDPVGDDVTFMCALDSALPGPCDASTMTYSGLADGQHTFHLQAVDGAKNHEPEQTVTWTVGTDADGDGVFAGDDCNDADGSIFPGANDPAGDGIDQDCDGADGSAFGDLGAGVDADGDGDSPIAAGGGDCNDKDPNVNSFAPEIPENGKDDDCDGSDTLKAGIGLRFEAVWAAGAARSRLVTFAALKVPAGTTITITCKGGCPFRIKHVQVTKKRDRVPLLALLGGRLRLAAGAVMTARATKPRRAPEGRVWHVRRNHRPLTAAFCEHDRKREPGRC